MAAGTLTATRSVQGVRRLRPRAIVGLLVAGVAFVATLSAWSAASTGRPVLVASRDLAAGHVLTAEDLAISTVRLDDSLYRAALPASESSSLIGRPLTSPAYDGQILVRQQVADKPGIPSGQVAMTVQVSTDRVAVGYVQRGDKVAIFATSKAGSGQSGSKVLVPEAALYDVSYDRGAELLASGSDEGNADHQPVASFTVLVSPEQAAQLAGAQWNSLLSVALLPEAGR